MDRLRRGAWVAMMVGACTSGCATYTESGAATGGLLGAATGAIVGNQTGDAGPGAIVGGALGAVAGGLVGAGMDDVDRKNQVRVANATEAVRASTITPADVIQMARSGVSDDVIVNSIHNSGAVVAPTASDVVAMHNEGVSDRAIQAMLDASRRRPVVARPNRVIYEPVYIVEPPPPRVSVGFGYYRPWPRRHWHHW